jgi:hypothetical protein
MLQPPQLLASLWTSAQTPLQSSAPAGQPHTPALQDWPAEHGVAQAPQFMRLVLVSMQMPPQSTWGSTHDTPPVVPAVVAVFVPAVVVVVGKPVVLVLVLVPLLLAVLPGSGVVGLLEQPHTIAKISDTSANRVVLCFIPSSSARCVLRLKEALGSRRSVLGRATLSQGTIHL